MPPCSRTGGGSIPGIGGRHPRLTTAREPDEEPSKIAVSDLFMCFRTFAIAFLFFLGFEFSVFRFAVCLLGVATRRRCSSCTPTASSYFRKVSRGVAMVSISVRQLFVSLNL